MFVTHTASLVSDDFDFQRITKDMVHMGFLVQLPFRLRVGEFYRHKFNCRGKSFEIVLYNRFKIPEDLPIHEVIQKLKQFDVLWTEALIIVRNPKITKQTLKNLRNWSPEKSSIPYFDSGGSIFDALEALNHFIVAYSTVTSELFGGNPLLIFRTGDFLEHMRWEIVIYVREGDGLTDQDCLRAFDLHPDREVTSIGQIHGDLHNLPIQDVRNGIDSFLQNQEAYVYYELAFEAKSKMVAGDYMGALLFSVAALEGAHAAFVQRELGSRLPGDLKYLVGEFLRELGMSLCNQITPYLFMEERERPNEETINKSTFALKIRNEIMHSLKNKRGEYRIRTRNNKEISEAYSAVLKTFACYIAALKKRPEVTTIHKLPEAGKLQ